MPEQTGQDEFNPQAFLEQLGVGSFAAREITGHDGSPITVAEAMVQCQAVGQAIKANIEGSRRTAAHYGITEDRFDPSAAMEGWIETMSDQEAVITAHRAANVDPDAVLAAAEKK